MSGERGVRSGQQGGRGGPGGFAMMGAKAKDFRGTMKRLLEYLREYRFTIIVVWVLAIVSTAFGIAGPWIMGVVTDEVVTGLSRHLAGTGAVDFCGISRILFSLGGLYLFSALCSWAQAYLMSAVSVKVSYKLRDHISFKIHQLPFAYFDGVSHGELLSRLTNDVDTVGQTLNMSLTQIITSITSVAGILVIMFSINWFLTIVSLVFLSLSLIFITLIVKQSQKFFKAQQRCLGKVNGHIEEMFSCHTAVRAFSGEADSVAAFEVLNNELYHAAWKANFLSGLLMPITAFVGNLTYVAVCIVGGTLAVRGAMTIGGIQSFIQYIHTFNQPLTQIANISNILQQTAAAAERVFEFLAEKEEIPDSPRPLAAPGPDSTVGFEHIRFGYLPEKPVIRDFSALVKPGQKIAIVGPTGAGKTTIVKLLMRFYDVDSGVITLGGGDIRQFRRRDLRALFGMVLQDTWLFSGAVADNIRYGRPGATDAQVEEAARAAQVDHFIHTWPGGYGMILNEEADNISAGQKQLLTIARAILYNPGMLILDEATSSVDTRTEGLIQKAMDNLMRGRTSFVIAHRLSTIKNADLILVMRDGDILEQGSHEELLKRDGFYAELYRSQFAGPEI
jgi:ATP-binding cassette subfamily B protein